MPQPELRTHVITLAMLAKVMELLTVLFTSSSAGPNGPTIPEIRNLFPDEPIHDRSPNDLWDDTAGRQVVEAAGVAEQELAGPQVAGALINQGDVGPTQSVSTIGRRIEARQGDLVVDEPAVLSRRDVVAGVAATWE